MNKRGAETRQLIKARACGLFAERGFKDVTMKDICEAAGLSRGGLYCHYDSTKQIFKEIIDDMMAAQDDEFYSQIERGLPAVDILDGVLLRYREEMLDSQASLSAALYEYFSLQETADPENALYRQYLISARAWRSLIEYGIRTHAFNEVDIEAVFHLIVFSYQGVRMYSKLMPIDPEIPAGIVREIRNILVGGNADGDCF